MTRSNTLAAFDNDEKQLARELLAAKVASMLGRKMEEDDWDFVYCNAKKIPMSNWSNLHVDVNFNGLGVEHKMLRVKKLGSILQECGTTKMHPAGTRSIRISPEGDPSEVAKDVLEQYGKLIAAREETVANGSSSGKADMRFGWLLWKETLDEFLYFEEKMVPPNPDNYFAQWNETLARGARKASRSLWIYDKFSGEKVYSVTTTAGAKIQPYFKVPNPTDPNLCHFVVQGVTLSNGLVEVWLTKSTARYLELICGGLDKNTVSEAILNFHQRERVIEADSEAKTKVALASDIAIPLRISGDAYKKLCSLFENISDEYLFQQLTLSMSK